MTDHKFTDDEIIHSLKVCLNDGDCSECLINPHKGNYGYCTSLAIKAALDLINRQKAEIESLQAAHADMTESLRLAAEANKDMTVELQVLRGAANSYKMHYENAKAEAIKEFAERLKSDLGRIPQYHFTRLQVEWSIDTLVKEMTEEQTNESQST